MRNRILGTLAAGALVFSACGGDDDGGNAQGEVADLMIETFSSEGLEVDEDCIRDATAQLNDSDAQAILDAGPEGDPEVSDDALAASEAMLECIDFGG